MVGQSVVRQCLSVQSIVQFRHSDGIVSDKSKAGDETVLHPVPRLAVCLVPVDFHFIYMVTYFVNFVKGVFLRFFRAIGHGANPFGILCTMKREKESSVRTTGTLARSHPNPKGIGFSRSHFIRNWKIVGIE